MSTNYAAISPLAQFTDLDGSALNGGQLYFGVANQNPITNPITVYWDAAGTQPAAQPIKTINGVPSNGGAPAQIFINGDYSQTVLNKRGSQIFYSASAAGYSVGTFASTLASPSNGQGADLVGGVGRVVNTIAALRALLKTGVGKAFVLGYYTAGDGGGGPYALISSTSSGYTDNGGSVIIANDGGVWVLCYTGPLSAKQFGAKGDGVTIDWTALQNWINALPGKTGYLPSGTTGNGAPFLNNPYIINQPLVMNSSTGGYKIVGDPVQWSATSGEVGGSIIKNTNTTGANAITVTAAQNGSIVLESFGILGSGTDGWGINATGAYNISVEKLFITGQGQGGVEFNSCYESHLWECSIGNQAAYGAVWTGPANNITVRDNIFFNCIYDCKIASTSGNNSLVPVVEGNTFEGGTGSLYGLIVQYCNGLNLRGNYFEIIPTMLYMDTTVSGFSIDGNYFQDGVVNVSGSSNGTIDNNIFQKETIATTLTVTPTGTGANNIKVGPHNVFLNGATNGSPASFGTATLVAGTVTVLNTNVNSGMVIMLSRNTPSGTTGDLRLGTITNGSSFVINSSSGTDTSTVNWYFVGY